MSNIGCQTRGHKRLETLQSKNFTLEIHFGRCITQLAMLLIFWIQHRNSSEWTTKNVNRPCFVAKRYGGYFALPTLHGSLIDTLPTDNNTQHRRLVSCLIQRECPGVQLKTRISKYRIFFSLLTIFYHSLSRSNNHYTTLDESTQKTVIKRSPLSYLPCGTEGPSE